MQKNWCPNDRARLVDSVTMWEKAIPMRPSSFSQASMKQQSMAPTLIVSVIYFAYAFTANCWGPLLTPLALQLHLPLDHIGWLFIIWSLGYLPGSVLGGTISDYSGSRVVLLGATLCMASALAGFILCLSFHIAILPVLLVLAGGAGAGGGTIDATCNGLMSQLYPQRRGVALNLFTLLYPSSAMLVSFVIGGFLFAFHNDVRPSLAVIIGLFVFAWVSGFFLFKSGSDHVSFPQPVSSQRAGSRQWFSSSLVALLLPVLLAMFLTTGLTATIRTWTPSYLHIQYGQTPALAALLSGLMNGFVILFRLLATVVVARIGAWATIVTGLGIACLGLIGVLLSQTQPLFGVLALTVVAIGCTPLVATFLSIGSDRAEQSFGSVAGLLLCITGISNMLWSGAFGWLLTHIQPSGAILFSFIMVVVGGIVSFPLRRNPLQPTKK